MYFLDAIILHLYFWNGHVLINYFAEVNILLHLSGFLLHCYSVCLQSGLTSL